MAINTSASESLFLFIWSSKLFLILLNSDIYKLIDLEASIKSLFDKSPLLSYETSLYYPIIEEDEEEPEIIEQPKVEEPVKQEPEDVIELSDGNIVDKAEEDEEETII